MKLILGLGNPGKEYLKNRHNAGAILVDKLCESLGIEFSSNKKTNCLEAKYFNCIFAKTLLYMNESGKCAKSLLDYYKVDLKDLLILSDDADLEFGSFKFSDTSSSAGHHGIQDIIDILKTSNFNRVRIGIGRPKQEVRDISNYVLSDFTVDEYSKLEKIGIEYLNSSFSDWWN